VRIWNSESGEQLGELVPGAGRYPSFASDDVHGLVVAGNGSRVALYIDRRMWLWDATTGELLHQLVDSAHSPLDNDRPSVLGVIGDPLSFSANGSRMVVRRHDGSIALLETNSGVALAETRGLTLSYSFAPDGRSLVVENDGVLEEVSPPDLGPARGDGVHHLLRLPLE
jgi:WD40 repeat protein